jgi:hypothetical protein
MLMKYSTATNFIGNKMAPCHHELRVNCDLRIDLIYICINKVYETQSQQYYLRYTNLEITFNSIHMFQKKH